MTASHLFPNGRNGSPSATGGGTPQRAPAVLSRKLRVLDLFSGIGGFSLGLERATSDGEYVGFETVAFCEIEEFPRKVLAKHWPDVPCYRDVRELTGERLRADGIDAVDVITGGFPCQDISTQGRQAGITDETRSGLWSEICRLAGELRPGIIIVENVAALLSGPSEQPGAWFGRVLGDLATLGFDAEWHCIPASSLGAPIRRDRAWIVAVTQQVGCLETPLQLRIDPQEYCGTWAPSATRHSFSVGQFSYLGIPEDICTCDGVPVELDGPLGAYGNAVVPAIPELIGNAILQSLNDAGHQTPDALASARPSLEPFHSA